jgi:hypothetical protein
MENKQRVYYIIRFLGNENEDVIKIKLKDKIVGYCGRGQIIVKIYEDYVNSEVLNLIDEIPSDLNVFGRWYFVPENKTDEFLDTKIFKDEWIAHSEYEDEHMVLTIDKNI